MCMRPTKPPSSGEACTPPSPLKSAWRPQISSSAGRESLALKDFCARLLAGEGLSDCENLGFLSEAGEPVLNPLRPLVKDLDVLPWRDYKTEGHKYHIYGKKIVQGDPMKGDPVFQMMGSRGCVYKCSYCYNSTYKKDVYPGQKWFRSAPSVDGGRDPRGAKALGLQACPL